MNDSLVHCYQNETLLIFKIDLAEKYILVEDDDVRGRLLSDDDSVNITANLHGSDFLAGYPRAKRHVGKIKFIPHTGDQVKINYTPSRRSHYGKSGFMLDGLGELSRGGYHLCVVMGSRPWVASLVHAKTLNDALELVTSGFPSQHLHAPKMSGMAVEDLTYKMCDHFNRCHLNNHNHPQISAVLSHGVGPKVIFQVDARNQIQLDDWLAHLNVHGSKHHISIYVYPGEARCKLVIDTASKYFIGNDDTLSLFPPL